MTRQQQNIFSCWTSTKLVFFIPFATYIWLTHLSQVPHICFSESHQNWIGSDNGLSPIRCQLTGARYKAALTHNHIIIIIYLYIHFLKMCIRLLKCVIWVCLKNFPPGDSRPCYRKWDGPQMHFTSVHVSCETSNACYLYSWAPFY